MHTAFAVGVNKKDIDYLAALFKDIAAMRVNESRVKNKSSVKIAFYCVKEERAHHKSQTPSSFLRASVSSFLFAAVRTVDTVAPS